MMSYKCGSIWPLRLDLSPLECREILREKELLCYSDVVSVLRAHGPLTEEKKSVLLNLQKIFSISEDRNKAELRRAANNEKLITIAENVSGFDAYAEWAALGALKMPNTQRPIPRTIYSEVACQTTLENFKIETEFLLPSETNDLVLSEKLDKNIRCNRILDDDCKLLNTCKKNAKNCTETLKKKANKDGSTSLDYNLHLLSAIATGESTQSEATIEPSDGSIKSDNILIYHQTGDNVVTNAGLDSPIISKSRHSFSNHIPMTTLPSNLLTMSNVKTILNTGHDLNINLPCNSIPIAMVNSTTVQRCVLPRGTPSQSINFVASNEQRKPLSGFVSNQPTSAAYLTLTNNQIRSPPVHQIGTAWTGQSKAQVYIQNASSQQGHGIQQNIPHQSMENFTSLGYTLQQRAVRAEQHQSSNKHNYIVRNFGTQSSMDPERNKRFMVVKGGNSTGPNTKKAKISNPSNRQPGRPPLMPAPSSVYTNRPYVANEIFHNSRTSSNTIVSIPDIPMIDSNGAKISASNNRVTVSSSHTQSNSYYSMNRGNGLTQRTNNSSVIQLGSGSNSRNIDCSPVVASVSSNTLKLKNIQPVISVVPLSPTGPNLGDNIMTTNVSMDTECAKDAIIQHKTGEQDSTVNIRVMSKDEVYANIMDRVNSSSVLSLN